MNFYKSLIVFCKGNNSVKKDYIMGKLGILCKESLGKYFERNFVKGIVCVDIFNKLLNKINKKFDFWKVNILFKVGIIVFI